MGILYGAFGDARFCRALAHAMGEPREIPFADGRLRFVCTSAYAQFAETRKGTLEAGKLADFVLLDRDLTKIPAPEIRDAHVLAASVGGKLVYENGK